MRFRDCFTVDLYARAPEKYSLCHLAVRLVHNTGYRAVVYYRIAMFFKNVRFLRCPAKVLGGLILVRLSRIPGVEIHTQFEIGQGLLICHPHDIVIGSRCRIGKNVTIYNGVSLGAKTTKAIDPDTDDNLRYPTIEDGVTLFSGAKIIGNITIGKNSVVGANSVVNTSFPENSSIAGVPARLVGKTQ